MFDELETIILKHDIKVHNLKKGDIGTIVHKYGDEEMVEVEFITAEGKTVAVLTLKPSDIRPIERDEMLHARPVSAISY